MRKVLEAAEVCIRTERDEGKVLRKSLRMRYRAVEEAVGCLEGLRVLEYAMNGVSAGPAGGGSKVHDGKKGGGEHEPMFGHHCAWFWCYLAFWTYMLGAWLWRAGGEQGVEGLLSLAFGLLFPVFL